MDGIKVKFWEGRQPGPEYYAPIDPYKEPPKCSIDLLALSRYAKAAGKKIVDLSYQEVMQFAIE